MTIIREKDMDSGHGQNKYNDKTGPHTGTERDISTKRKRHRIIVIARSDTDEKGAAKETGRPLQISLKISEMDKHSIEIDTQKRDADTDTEL